MYCINGNIYISWVVTITYYFVVERLLNEDVTMEKLLSLIYHQISTFGIMAPLQFGVESSLHSLQEWIF